MQQAEKTSVKTIAVCGKGGVGKTSISSLLVRALSKNPEKRILAIDADPAIGLATSLGFDVDKTVDSIRNEVIDATRQGRNKDTVSLLARLNYEIFDALSEQGNIALLAIGRPEADGCYCKVNSFLRSMIKELSDKFDYVVIDGEAGIEQVNRRVMDTVTHLLLVSDASRKGCNVIRTIHEVGRKIIGFDRAGVILNRLKSEVESELVDLGQLSLLGCIVEDDQIRTADIKGSSLLDLQNGSAIESVEQILGTFGLTD